MLGHHSRPTRRTPFLVIMGAMKCGTTALFEYLSAHPAICPCRQKEPGFFAFEEKFSEGIDSYFRLWNFNQRKHIIAMEATTSYTKFPGLRPVPARIASSLEDVKFVYLMRDPVARIESQFNHCIYEGRFGWDEPILSKRLVVPSMYHTQLTQYLEFYPAGRILLLNAGDLATNPELVMHRVCEFAGINTDICWPPFRRVHETKELSRVENWLREGPLPSISRVPVPLRKRIFRGATVGRRRMTPEERSDAWAVLDVELDALEAEFGFDTSSIRLTNE